MNPLIHKLSNYINLPQADSTVLKTLSRKPEHIAAHTDLIRESAAPDSVYLILTGWACRYKVLPDGKRQIMDYFIPGDLSDQRIFVLTHRRSPTDCTGPVVEHTGGRSGHPRVGGQCRAAQSAGAGSTSNLRDVRAHPSRWALRRIELRLPDYPDRFG
jgi:hypothetical protein